ncbi:la-related protein 7 [Cimex lectularius]|uniref:Uncharacterized protein n=1 Tax=Cimex lectularius TaxID=79782 RepID=A0A8I6SC66_CIMLE|nr:la-related protein 7 [Cimex lectularius]
MEEVEEPKQKDRSRKKQLYASIRNLMEFYFSPSNLAKNNMTAELLKTKGSIELTEFLSYNKIRALTNNIKDLRKALKHSTELEVTDEMKVKPKNLVMKDNIDECTIYVEHVPPDADHDWLKEQFSIYGSVDYISIPKYSSSKKCKGFAFIEFSKPEFAEKAVEEYKKVGSYLSTAEMDPKHLLSIATYETKSEGQLLKENANVASQPCETKKRKADKTPEHHEEEVKAKKQKANFQPETEEADKLQEEVAEGEEVTEEVRKKKNRNKKKKAKKAKVTAETSGFQILSKKDWKHLRNKYLMTQREKTTMLKQHLRQLKQKQQDHTANKYREQEENNHNINQKNSNSTIPSEFTPGIIVKINMNEPVISRKQFKDEINVVSSAVKYVDVKEGAMTVYVRLKTEEDTRKFCEDAPWQEVEILKGEEELEYWKRIQKDREEKLNKPKVKQRGKEKLFKKAEKVLGHHITFN